MELAQKIEKELKAKLSTAEYEQFLREREEMMQEYKEMHNAEPEEVFVGSELWHELQWEERNMWAFVAGR